MIQRASNPNDLSAAIDRLDTVHVCVVGDVMLDRFVHGGVARISPEAPVPVVAEAHVHEMPGGAANVAMNLLAYGARATLIGVCGAGPDGETLIARCAAEPGLEARLVREEDRRTTVKTRIVVQNQQMIRLDSETAAPVSAATAEQIIADARKIIPGCGALILSDYAKGVLTPDICKELSQIAAEAGVPVLVDPKRQDLDAYSSVHMVSPNLRELAEITGINVRSDADAARACDLLLDRFPGVASVLATRGEAGMTLVERGGEPLHVPAMARSVFDVSGAGDTVIATVAAGLATGLSLADAVRLGNAAAGIAVGKAGTSTVSREELRHGVGIDAPHRPVSREQAAAIAGGWREAGKTVGFTNGCFDLLHAGHLHGLEYARSRCDVLIVGVNADASVKRLKGESRPVQDEASRARLLASLRFCDLVVIFDEDTPQELIAAVQPDVLFKGADYEGKPVVGRDVVEARGGRVELVPLLDGHSTTNLVNRLRG
ncbi:D-glycero-beta-D-manno-heptose-7-phosphate kinase [Tepidamorphus sp. 3E244]|uniref:D-glycero-beta-D-manno-heptose-7-phosphate kinase n=1 Tax=Tepidamorphus sp. 3E244 TaxID=3385498 RepID=UPI0038FC0839